MFTTVWQELKPASILNGALFSEKLINVYYMIMKKANLVMQKATAIKSRYWENENNASKMMDSGYLNQSGNEVSISM
jgi:hypothetical protein